MRPRIRSQAQTLQGIALILLLLSEVALCEGAPGAGLEVSLEGDRASLVGELHNDIQTPGLKGRCVRAATVVVRSKTCRHVRGHSGVVARRIVPALQDVDESLDEWHATRLAKRGPLTIVRDAREIQRGRSTGIQELPGAFACEVRRNWRHSPPGREPMTLVRRSRRALSTRSRQTAGWSQTAWQAPQVGLPTVARYGTPAGPPSLATRAMGGNLRVHSERRLEAPPGFEPGMEVLQTSALPLGYGAETTEGG
jgi:hypothetical protein